MSREPPQESRITTDTDTIRTWGDRQDLVPVRYEGDEGDRLDLVRRSNTESRHDELSWSEFEEAMRRDDKVVVHHDDDTVEVVDRSRAVGPGTMQGDEGESLLEGDTVETEFTERRVVEHTIVEEATVESEIVDREIVDSEILTADLISTEIDGCTVARRDEGETTDHRRTLDEFEPGARSDVPYDVDITADEAWTVTKEVAERITIESRVVETDVEDTETVETDTVEADTVEVDTVRETIGEDNVQQTVVAGELVASPETAEAAVESGHVETTFHEDDTIRTHLIRNRVVEEDFSVRREFAGELTDSETVTADAITHQVVESEIVDSDDYDTALVGDEGAMGTTTDETATGTTVDETATGTTATDDEMGTATADDEMATTESTAGTVSPSADEEGKTVVNASGDEVGMVAAVDDGRMYVDPHPSITDRIRTALGWSDQDEDTYPVENEHVARIEDDRVVLGVDRQG